MHKYYCFLLKNFHQLPLDSDTLMQMTDAQLDYTKSMSSKRLHEFYFSRKLLEHAIKTKGIYSNWEIIEREKNSPLIQLNNNKALNCSITHSPTWIGVIFNNEIDAPKVGIDIETIRSNWTIEKAQLFCSDQQVKHAYNLPSDVVRNHCLTTIWTQKEAYYKAVGEGLFNKNVELKSDANTQYSLTSQALTENAIMSIYCEEPSAFKVYEVSYLNNEFRRIVKK